MLDKETIVKGRTIYWGRCVRTVNLFEVVPLIIHDVRETYFTALPARDKRTYIFSYNQLNVCVFSDPIQAQDYVDYHKAKEFNPKLSKQRDTDDTE